MDVKSSFLNGYLKEEPYVEQPQGFIAKVNNIRFICLKRIFMVLNNP
jgi:hypothetical protein